MLACAAFEGMAKGGYEDGATWRQRTSRGSSGVGLCSIATRHFRAGPCAALPLPFSAHNGFHPHPPDRTQRS